jgi:hypothetical protein
MRRVDFVRVTVCAGRATCEAVGVVYRLPATRRIPLHLATTLAGLGIPTVMHRATDARDR